jgi:hypothetical protein
MCGTVGLFVGCAAVTFCPLRDMLGPGGSTTDEGEAYADRSPLRGWYERASVRTAARRTLDGDEPIHQLFPRELVPIANHPIMLAQPETVPDQAVAQQLFRYLDFTAKLELLVVNRTMVGIAGGSIGLRLPDQMRLDALKMYCDEGYHALQAVDLMWQAADRTGVAPRLPDQPFFLIRLGQLLDGLEPADRALAELLFVIVSETLISATLADVLTDGQADNAVLHTIRDHALDEGRHHAYFVLLLRSLWGQLTRGQRELAGRLVPSLIDAFLRPDLPGLRRELAGYGLSPDAAETVLGETYPTGTVQTYARMASRHTRNYFAQLGAFDSAAAADQLDRFGLTPCD